MRHPTLHTYVPRKVLCRRQALVLLGLAATLRPARAQNEDGSLGAVEAVTGDAFAEAAPPRRLDPGTPVHPNETVVTSPSGRLSILFQGGSRVHLGPGARLTIDRFLAETGGDLTLGGGAMVFDRPEDAPKAEVSVKTVFGLIGVRGTRFFAGPSNGAFGLFVDRGAVIFRTADALRELGPGDGIDVAQPGAVPSEVRRWPAERVAAAFASVLG